ncbi:hypothetical protein AVEN_26506-2-1, partial [Araneus ventricosus]
RSMMMKISCRGTQRRHSLSTMTINVFVNTEVSGHFRDISQSAENPHQYKEGNPMDVDVCKDSSERSRVSDDLLAIPGPSGVQHVNTVSGNHVDSDSSKRNMVTEDMLAIPGPSGVQHVNTVIDSHMTRVRRLITGILQRSTVGLSPQDLVRICVFAPGLDYPISTCLHNVADMTVETLLYEICKVLQKIDRLRKESVISIPFDDEGICCARAIVVGHAAATTHPKYNSIRNGKWPLQKTLALQLHQNSGVPVSACGVDEIKKFEQFLNVQIHAISSENFNKLIYKGEEKTLKLYLWHHDNHYDLIKSMSGFLGKNFIVHIVIKAMNITGNIVVKIVVMNVILKNVLSKEKRSPDQHICGESKCISCKQYVCMNDHLCFLEEKTPKTASEKFIFFDFEAMQETGKHIVNFAILQYFGTEKVVFEGKDTVKKFYEFLFSRRHKGYTVIAHNLKGYDAQFILAHLLSQRIKPQIITSGSKIMSMEVSSYKIRFIDSLNFLTVPLSNFPKTFELEELTKGYFPHFYNTEENQTYVGTLPDVTYYAPHFMNTAERKKFMKWYEEREEQPFDFRKELYEYCKSDVDILRRCCLQFRADFLAINGVDPFSYSTIASVCMAVYRSKHLPAEMISMIPLRGYTASNNFSKESIEWLKYMEHTLGVCHALNG